MHKKRGYRSSEARERRWLNRVVKARSEVSRLALVDEDVRETINFSGFAELAEMISRQSAGILFYMDVKVGEVLSDSRGEGSFQQVVALAQEA